MNRISSDSFPAAEPGHALKIAIFGSGYLGNRLAAAAIRAGHEVFALTRNADRAAELRALGASAVVEAQLHEDDWHARFTELHYDLAVNCVSSGIGGGLEAYRQSYLEGMRSIARWAAPGGRVGHFLYTGATSVYPQINGERVTEADVPAELTASGALLLEAEHLVRESASLFGRATVLRLGAIYGPHRHYMLKALRQGQTLFPGRGDFIINHIHVDDAIRAICAVWLPSESSGAQNQSNGAGSQSSGARDLSQSNEADDQCRFSVYNVVDGAYPTKREVLCHLAGIAGVLPGQIVFDAEQMSARAERRQVPGAPTGVMPNRRVCNEAIRRDLGWYPRYASFREGYAQILEEEEGAQP